MKAEILKIAYKLRDNTIDDKEAKALLLILPVVSESVTCFNCNGWGYTLLPNGKRDKHCTVCDGSNVR